MSVGDKSESHKLTVIIGDHNARTIFCQKARNQLRSHISAVIRCAQVSESDMNSERNIKLSSSHLPMVIRVPFTLSFSDIHFVPIGFVETA